MYQLDHSGTQSIEEGKISTLLSGEIVGWMVWEGYGFNGRVKKYVIFHDRMGQDLFALSLIFVFGRSTGNGVSGH